MFNNTLKFKGRTAIFIDYANIKAWVKDKDFFIDLKVFYDVVKKAGADKIIFYYGTDEKNPSSFGFLNKLRSFGFEVVTKPVRYMKISLLGLLNKRVNQEWLKKLSAEIRKILTIEIEKLEKRNIKLFSPKANFDVEITLDMLLFLDEFENFILFSGDGDFVPIVKYLRSKNKNVIVIAGRKFLAGELLRAANTFITLERFSARIDGLLKKQDLPKRRS